MDKQKLGLMPLSEEELNDYYAGYGACHCPGTSEDKPGPYNPDCCWHDCNNGSQSTKFLTGWG